MRIINKRWIVIGSAPDTDLSILNPLLAEGIPVVCADGGVQAAQNANIKPDFYVGDLDSGVKPEKVEGIILPTEKDYTDLHSALLWISEQGAEQVYIYGCTNGRADHYLANVFLLEMLYKIGVKGVILDKQNAIFFNPPGETVIKRENSSIFFDKGKILINDAYKYISILPLDSCVSGVSIQGMKYPLIDSVIERANPIGVSNEMVLHEGRITVKNGNSIIIFSKDV